MNVINLIPYGRENAIKRTELSELSGLRDRPMREEIEAARHSGYLVINDQSGAGYYLVDSSRNDFTAAELDEMEHQFRLNERRAKSILHYQKPLRQILKSAGRL